MPVRIHSISELEKLPFILTGLRTFFQENWKSIYIIDVGCEDGFAPPRPQVAGAGKPTVRSIGALILALPLETNLPIS